MTEIGTAGDSFERVTGEPIVVTGGYEDYTPDGETTVIREHLDTLTRTGRLLRDGDLLPSVPGLETGRVTILQSVNAFNTETCDKCTDILEAFQLQHPEIQVVSLTKQDLGEVAAEEQNGGRAVTHTRLQIDHETAIDLGIALAPGEGADEVFWATALRRTLAVVDEAGQVVHIEQPMDQNQEPDFDDLFRCALWAHAAAE